MRHPVGVLLGLIALLATTASSAVGAYPGANGQITFHRADGYIYSVNPDGTALRKLGRGTTPAYSPNGNRIAFHLDGDVWTMNADGTNRKRVTTAASWDYDPTWSPDGARLAFASDRNGGGILTVRSSAPYGTPARVVTTPTDEECCYWIDYSPAWATNGLIYFTRYPGFNEGFCQDSPATMSVNPLTNTVRRWKWPTNSADPAPRSRAMVYQAGWSDGGCNFGFAIRIANIDGSNPRAVTPLRVNPTAPDTEPVFSPDAAKVAFQRGRYLYVVNSNGTGLRRLVVGSAPSWQPVHTNP